MSIDIRDILRGLGAAGMAYGQMRHDQADEAKLDQRYKDQLTRQGILDDEDRAERRRRAALDERQQRGVERTAFMKPGEEEAKALRDQGIFAPGFANDSALSRLGSMAGQITGNPILSAVPTMIETLRTAGKQGVDRVYQEAPEAMNTLYAGKGLSQTMPGGGMVMMDPSVRASLDYAASTSRTAAANRKNDMDIALLKANDGGAGDPAMDRLRVQTIGKRMAELMKPQLDKFGRATGPGMNQAAALRQAQQEWQQVQAQPQPEAPAAPVPVPDATGGSAALALPGMGSFGQGAGAGPTNDAAEARSLVAGMDDMSARQVLETAGYSDIEIEGILGGQ